MHNLTPSHLRCGVMSSCPSINQLEDGRLLIVGTYSPARARLNNVPMGEDETAIVISPEYFSDYISKHIEAALSAGSLVISAGTYIRLRDWLATGKSAVQGFTAGLERQIAYVIESAISQHVEAAVRAEREAIARMLADTAESFAFEANLHSDPSRIEILMAKGHSCAEAATAIRSRGNANG
jgi:hypothetical protein